MRSEWLIIFTRYPQAGAVKTRLIPLLGPQGAAECQRQMTARTLEVARELREQRLTRVVVRFTGGSHAAVRRLYGADLDYVAQGPGHLGQRLHDASEDAFRLGAGAVVLVGSDCPDLTAELIGEAFDVLHHCDVVLGPADDGGYYLIALRRHTPLLFAGIDWGSERVLEQTCQRAAQAGLGVHRLRTLRDVDRPEDLPNWLRTTPCSR